MDKQQMSTRIAEAIREEKWLRIKTVVSLPLAGKTYTVEDDFKLFPLVQDDYRVYGFFQDGGSGTSVQKDIIVELEIIP